MSTIVTRAGKGSPLTHTEVDNNFTNLNTDKYQSGNNASFGTLSASGAFSANGGATLGDASGDALTINSSAVSIPNGLNFDSNTLVIDATNNRVGVGVASPSQSLSVVGNSQVSPSTLTSAIWTGANNTSGNFQLGIDNSTGGGFTGTAYARFLYSDGAYPLVIMTNGGERMRITSTGNVGIGTSSPDAKFHVLGGNGDQAIFDASSGSRFTQATFRNNGTSKAAIWVDNTASLFELYGYSGMGMTFSTNGSERMRLDSSGNLGLGVTPSAWNSGGILQVKNGGVLAYGGTGFLNFNAFFDGASKYITTAFAGRQDYDSASGAFKWNLAPSGTAGNAITFTQAMTLDASGNLGIGTTSPARKLHVAGGASVTYLQLSNDASGNTNADGFQIYQDGTTVALINRENGYMSFDTNNTERMRIDSSGNLLVGTTSSFSRFTVKAQVNNYVEGLATVSSNSSNWWSILSTNSNDLYFGYNTGDKAYISSSTGAYTALSDQRLKKNISNISYGLNQILALRAVSYNMNDQADDAPKSLGFIAQEAMEVVPESVSEMMGGMYGMSKESIIPVLVKAIQEQQTIINDLKARIETLESK
jgi:hypothetical protein